MKNEAIQTVFRHQCFLVYISAEGMHLHREGPVTVSGNEQEICTQAFGLTSTLSLLTQITFTELVI